MVIVTILSIYIRLKLIEKLNKFAFSIGYSLSVSVYSNTLYRPYLWHISTNTSYVLAGLQKVQQVIQRFLMPLLDVIVAGVIGIGIITTLILVNTELAIYAGALWY